MADDTAVYETPFGTLHIPSDHGPTMTGSKFLEMGTFQPVGDGHKPQPVKKLWDCTPDELRVVLSILQISAQE